MTSFISIQQRFSHVFLSITWLSAVVLGQAAGMTWVRYLGQLVPPLQSDAQVTPFGVNRRNLTGLHAGHTVVIISVSHCETEFHE